jgi:SEFIR domain
MESEQLASLLANIRNIQSLMILIALREKNIQNEDANYKNIYEQLAFEIDMLHDEGFKADSLKDFQSLWDWYNHYSSSEMDYIERGAYVHDLYDEVISEAEVSLCNLHFLCISQSQSISELSYSACEELKIKIEKLKSILLSTTKIDKIRAQEEAYQLLYGEVDRQLIIWRSVGILAENPNRFKSLWQWLKCRREMDDFFAGAEQYIDAIYKDLISSTRKSLYKANTLSYEEFIQALKKHFPSSLPANSINLHENLLKDQQESKPRTSEIRDIRSSNSEVQNKNLDATTIKVFISYSHDSQEHKDRVRKLFDQLWTDGIICSLDQYEDSPVDGWERWMMNQVETADFVLVVCTKQYNLRFRGNEGKGVNWEGSLIIRELYEAEGKNSKFIPIVFTPEDVQFIPSPLRSTTNYILSTIDTFDKGYDLLYRRLTNQPVIRKPELGQLRTLPLLESKRVPLEISSLDPTSISGLNDGFEVSDRTELADLLKRSGRATDTARRSLCQSLGLTPADLSFVSSIYSEKDFAIELVNHLRDTGFDLTKLCDEIKPHLHGQQKQQLEVIYNKVRE